jgi:hypothetical protein
MPRTRKIRYVPAIISGNGCEKFGSKSLKPRICFTEPGRNIQSHGGFVGEDSHFHPHTAMYPMQTLRVIVS